MTRTKKTVKRRPKVSDEQRHAWQEQQFVSAGVQYYIAARGGALAGLMPVSGNVMHHAIEMLAKAGIIKHNSANSFVETQKTLKSVGHHLKRAWNRFRRCYPGAQLATFDALIAYLDRWEDIRYPDPDRLVGASAVAMSIGRRKGQQPQSQMPGGKQVEFLLNVEECDELVKAMWHALGLSPAYFRHFLHVSKHASEVYTEDNLHTI